MSVFPGILLVLVTIVYFLYFLRIVYGWYSLKDNPTSFSGNLVTVSVIIAARNEETDLPHLLSDLAAQNYPDEHIEIIIIDDHSVKDIRELPFIKNTSCPNLKVERLTGQLKGKKAALLHGAKLSTSDLLLFTDADCRVGEGWIRSFVDHYSTNKSGLMLGLIDYWITPGILSEFYRFEMLALEITGAGSAALGYPTLCNGANLAVNRELYLELVPQMNAKTPSGDDIFLLHAAKKRNKSDITVNRSVNSIVFTGPPLSARHFLNQRARWASKASYYTDRDTLFLASMVLVANLVMVIAFLFSLNYGKWLFFILTYCIKTMADCLVIGAGLKFFRGFGQIFLVPFFGLFYPLYIMIAALLGAMNMYSWKGRKARSFIQ